MSSSFPRHPADGHHHWLSWIDWKSLLLGSMASLAVGYVGFVRPAHDRLAQLSAVEGEVSRLTEAVEMLGTAGRDVADTTSLLARLEHQAARLAGAETALERFTALEAALAEQAEQIDALQPRIAAAGDAIEATEAALVAAESLAGRARDSEGLAEDAEASIERVAGLHRDLHDAIAGFDAFSPLVERLEGLAASLAAEGDGIATAETRLGRLIGLQRQLVAGSVGLDDAAETLARLGDLRDGLAGITGTVGELQRFVVNVMLLEPAVDRAVRALEPVVEFTRAGRRLESATTEAATKAAATTAPAEDAAAACDGEVDLAATPEHASTR